MANRFTDFQPQGYISQYVPLPLETLYRLGEQKQRKQDEAVHEKEQFLGKTWNRLGPDAEKARTLKDKNNAILQEFSGKDFNDPKTRADWYKTKMQLADTYGPDGPAGAQERNFNNYQASVKEYTDMLKKGSKDGGIDQNTFNYLTKKAMDDYRAQGGIGEKGPEGYQNINMPTPAAYQDLNDQALKIGNGFKADAIARGSWTDTSGKQWVVKNSHDWESVDPEEVRKAVKEGLMSDKMNQAYVNQQADVALYGKDTENGTDGYGNDVSYKPGTIREHVINNMYDVPADMVAKKEGYTKTKQDQDIRENTDWVNKAKDKRENPIPITIFNDSIVTPGKPTDYNSLSTNVTSLKEQIAALPPVGSTNDNYQTKAQREDLNKQLTIANNYLNSGRTKYYDSKEGVNALSTLYNRISTPGFKEASKQEMTELTPHMKSKQDFIDYMKNSDSPLKNQLENMTGLKSSLSDYIAKNPISYSAYVLTSPDSSEKRHSAVNDMNKALTQEVDTNGTNYLTVDGTDLNTWKSKNLEEGDKVEVASLSKPINGQYAHYYTVRDKDGKVKIEMPIYPKSGGREILGDNGKKIMDENSDQSTELEKTNYKNGLAMVAQSKYGDKIQDEYLESFEPQLRNNSGIWVDTRPRDRNNKPINTIIDTEHGPVSCYTRMTKKNGITLYELMGENGKLLSKKPEKSPDDLRISIDN